jgi:glycosyltransferase involved in cell wall biosynthesis
LLTLKRPALKIRIKIIGWYDSEKEQKIFEKMIASFPENVSFKFYPMQDYLTFIELINDTDIFLDLRSDDFENQRCLPIKLFYYAALKRPVIFTNLKAIRKEVDISKFGHLVKPDNIETISGLILNYIDNQTIYNRHCTSARKLAESKYNWGAIKDEFTEFLQKLIEE